MTAVKENDVRQRILESALDLFETQGIEALTQPRIAKHAHLRQSHLTYYFPRRPDLYVALLDASHERAVRRSRETGETDDAISTLQGLIFDRQRMRFFLRILLEIGDSDELGEVVKRHADHLEDRVGAYFERPKGDPRVAGFVNELRGLGIRQLFERSTEIERDRIFRLAHQHGLSLPDGDG